MSMNSVGIVVCSDEVLNDKKCECVSQYLIQELNLLQFSVNKVTVIPSNESSILIELISLIKYYDIVVAISEKCGSLYKALAAIISQELEKNKDLIRFFEISGESYEKEDVFLPIPAKVLLDNNTFPVVHFQRVFILKEKYVRQSFSCILKNYLLQYKKPKRFQKTVQITQISNNSLSELNEINHAANDCLRVECSKDNQFYTLKITGSELSYIVDFEKKLKGKFDLCRLKFFDNSDVWDSVYGSNEHHVKTSIDNIEQCLSQYGPNNIFVSFNGGKDCTVLLHLVLTVIKKKYPYHTDALFCLYVQNDNSFPEQEEFINLTKSFYNLKIVTVRSGIKDALQETLQLFPNYKACFMGTRRTDPYSSDLNVFQMTDSNWPQIMRVSPLLDWHYSDIWDYLLFYKVPYCELYDMGFTSLGNTVNTTRNPSLIYYDPLEGKEMYLPAYKLLKQTKERNGRHTS